MQELASHATDLPNLMLPAGKSAVEVILAVLGSTGAKGDWGGPTFSCKEEAASCSTDGLGRKTIHQQMFHVKHFPD